MLVLLPMAHAANPANPSKDASLARAQKATASLCQNTLALISSLYYTLATVAMAKPHTSGGSIDNGYPIYGIIY